MQKKGLSCLNQTLDFDEHQVLMTNIKYLKSTLQVFIMSCFLELSLIFDFCCVFFKLNDLEIMFTTDIKSDSSIPAQNFDDVVPGKPLIFYE